MARARSADRADAAITPEDLLSHLLTSSYPTALISVRAILAAAEHRDSSSSAVTLPPSAATSITINNRRHLVSDLALPHRSGLHAIACAAAAAENRFDGVERHAHAGLSSLSSVLRHATTTTDDDDAYWASWRELCLAHAALLASQRLAADDDGSQSRHAGACRGLLHQLHDHCVRREAEAHNNACGIGSVLRVAAAACATCTAQSPAHRPDALRTLAAALRCACRELTPTLSEAAASPASSSGRSGTVEAQIARMLEGLLHAAADRRGDGVPPPAKRSRAAANATVDAPTRAALLRCGSLAAVLLATSLGGETRPGGNEALRMLELCLPDDSLPEPLRPGVMGSDADLETRRAIASALHVRATSRTAVALARVTAESAAASASSLPGDGDAAADGLLHAAERDAALAVALRAGGTAASSLDVDADSSGDVAAACASRRAHAILLLLLGRLTDAATQLGQPAATGRAGNGARPTKQAAPVAPPSAHDCDDATVSGVVRACRGDLEGSLDSLQHALAVGSIDGRAAALPLYNLYCHFDRTRQRQAALRLADYFGAADFSDATAAGRPHTEYMTVHAAAKTRHASLVLHAANAVLCPIAARYLRARAGLLAKEWAESSAALHKLLGEERSLWPTLRAMGHGERHLLLRQLALSMLHEGEHHELITLLKARGASSNPLLAGMLADALLCEHEVSEALDAATVALDAAVVTKGAAGASERTAAEEDAAKRAELRARNNRACCLVCNGSYNDAELELIAALKIAPRAIEPAYNLALLRWKVGERHRAAEGWLRFRGWPLAATPDVYSNLVESTLPARGGTLPSEHGAVTGKVDPASAAALDRAVLRHWASIRSEASMREHWGAAAE